ncbi:MAG: Gfo/Idh/MocA family oxidoreductase [Anaerolineales bacterium]|nr:Gfo/Idh/MocA family oxidoreductase [Anaerolineales bacterium]
MSSDLRIGIVGLGKMGMIRKDVLEGMEGVKVTALCDPTFENIVEVQDDLLRTADYGDLIDSGIEAIFICTPNNVTAEIAVASLEAGLHVFCEKPPGRDLTDTRAILEAAERMPGLKLKFGFNHRYHGSVIQAHAMVNSGHLGKLLWMRGVYGKSGGLGFDKSWRSDRDVAGGGILLDQGIHMLDLFRLFAGEFAHCQSMVTNSYWPIDMEDNVFALLRTEEGIVATLHSSATLWKHTFLLDIGFTEGHLSLDGILSGTGSYGPETLVISRRQFEDESFALGKPRQEVVYFDTDHSWAGEINEFIDCIRNDKPIEVGTPEDAWRTMELVYRIYASDEAWRHSDGAEEEIKNQGRLSHFTGEEL